MGGYIGSRAVNLSTTAADVSGNATIGGNLTVSGTTVTIDSANAQTVDLGDNDKIRLGDGDDLQIYHDASNSHISNATGNLTLDVAGDVILDADGGTIKFKDGGTHIANIGNSSSDLVIENKVQDKDIKFLGDDGGAGVTALTLDMSDAGTATFNHDINAGGNLVAKGYLASEATNSTNKWLAYTYTDNTFRINYNGAGADELTIDSSGNVGIGLSSGLSGLNVNGAVRSQNSSSHISYVGFTSYTGSSAAGGMYSYMGGDGRNTGYLNFSTNDAERMRIGSSGEMQLGGTTNAGFIDFDGSSLQLNTQRNPNTGAFQNTGRAHTGMQFFDGNGTASNSYIRFFTTSSNNTTATERMRIDSAGKVYIGGTSADSGNLLTVYGSDAAAIFQSSTTGTGASNGFTTGNNGTVNSFVWNYENGFMQFGTNNAERMRILDSGGITFNGDTAAANALNDYEEGTMTLTLTNTGNVPTISEGRTFTGYYTKVGQLVNCWGYTGGRTITGAGTGIAKITGLPFQVNDAYGVGTFTHCTMFASGGNTTAYLETNTDAFFPLVEGGTAGVAYDTGTKYMMFHVVYRTNS